ASLVGALSIGAPAVALAANGGIEMLAATAAEAYNQGVVSEYKIGTKTVAGNADVKIAVSDATNSTIEITKVKPAGSDTEDVAVSSTPSKSTIFFKKVPATTPASECLIIDGVKYQWLGTTMPKNVGDYVAIVKYSADKGTDGYVETAKGHTADVPTLKFSIVADSLEGAELAAQDEKTGEYTVTDFSYDGATKWSDLKIAIAGKSTNVDFTVYVKGTDKQVAASELIQAGDYTVIAKPTTGDYAGQSFEQDVKVSKLDLSKLGLYIDDRLASDAAPSISDIKFKDGSKFNGLAEQYDLKLTSHSIYQNNTTGTYSYELTVAEGNSDAQKLAQDNVEGKAVLTFNRLAANTAASWKYDGHDLANVTDITVDASASANSFTGTAWTLKSIDLSKLSGSYNDVDGKSIDLASGEFAWTIKDSDGNVVTDFSKKGDYTVSVEANPSKLEYSVARSTKTFNVTVKQGTIGKADVIFTFDGAVKNGTLTQTYDGKDFLSRIGITVKDSKGNALKAGEDYKVVVKNGENKAVTEIVDADTYTVTIESDSYDVETSNKLTVKVEKRSVTPVFDTTAAPFKTFYSYEKNSVGKLELKAHTNVPYTGSKIDGLTAGYMADIDGDGENEFAALPDGSYTLTYKKDGKVVDALKDAGKYSVEVNPTNNLKNFTFALTPIDVTVEKDMSTGFVDVADEEWYAEPVNRAKVLGYVNGLRGTEMFAPKSTITRADVTCILFNMAGGETEYEGRKDETGGYETGFSDVDAHEYYALAIQWAKQAGVVNGYGDGTFNPLKQITREEFASMLANFAKSLGDDVTVENADKVLGAFADADTVSDWAESNVAWAVENGIMGNGGFINGNGAISRAETASMAVNYMPGDLA
ncbi:S-layer homology domain-containing protein, partial [Collinsella tanakaei]|uniref:S-layer homology domain-containing protein n=1 Tax=Collinsella tanakaei TaxID=626935 RepID=UPI0022E07D76